MTVCGRAYTEPPRASALADGRDARRRIRAEPACFDHDLFDVTEPLLPAAAQAIEVASAEP